MKILCEKLEVALRIDTTHQAIYDVKGNVVQKTEADAFKFFPKTQALNATSGQVSSLVLSGEKILYEKVEDPKYQELFEQFKADVLGVFPCEIAALFSRYQDIYLMGPGLH